ncbi:hypothetical protein CBW65_10025 [Tumebacillus avium]|uniref:Uncharacterized protein n=1 Tax=Tumebacillus avium TaxID=1903704 RepID=A0A1Y0IPN9_9BACL|nr:hypothetical protein [Tumebacillus avium]ARU61294.1 hypothetical protein CBW65_10025 [Tumebacillus avium]
MAKNRLNKRSTITIPKAIVMDQAWFWSKEWQSKEREAEEDLQAGRVSGPFTSMDDIKARLDSLK